MTDNIISTIVKSIVDPTLLREIYGDLLKPGVSQVGLAISTLLGLGNTAMWPIQLLNERARIALTTNLEQYRRKMEVVPEKDVVPVPPELGVPILEKLAYISDETLSDFYSSLLASASTQSGSRFAHPSFPRVLESMSPDEARLLVHFGALGVYGLTPFITAVLHQDEGMVQATLQDYYFGFQPKDNLVLCYPDNLYAYVSNLEGLGLISVDADREINCDEEYERIEFQYFNTSRNLREETQTLRGSVSLTFLGVMLLVACNKFERPDGDQPWLVKTAVSQQ